MPTEYYAINNEEVIRQEAEYEKREKLREESHSNQGTHSQASSGGEAHDDLEGGVLARVQEESSLAETVPPPTKTESAQISPSEARIEDETTDDAQTPSDLQTRIEHQSPTQGQSTAVFLQKGSL